MLPMVVCCGISSRAAPHQGCLPPLSTAPLTRVLSVYPSAARELPELTSEFVVDFDVTVGLKRQQKWFPALNSATRNDGQYLYLNVSLVHEIRLGRGDGVAPRIQLGTAVFGLLSKKWISQVQPNGSVGVPQPT